MVNTDLGKVIIINKGEYNSSINYELLDIVTYNGSSYLAKSNVNAGILPTNTTYWQVIAEKGDKGDKGDTGATGNGIASIVKTSTSGNVDTYTITFTDGTTTTYEVTNGAVTSINGETGDITGVAKVDGYYETFGYAREAGIAKNLQNDEGKLLDPDVDTSSGTTYADAPFVQRATAMSMKAYLDNELITVGSGYEQWRKEQAFSIVRNNKIQNGKFESISKWSVTLGTFTVANNIGTYTITSLPSNLYGARIINNTPHFTNNHKFLVAFQVRSSRAGAVVSVANESWLTNGLNITCTNANTWYFEAAIINGNASENALWIKISDYENIQIGDTLEIQNVVFIDLTQWFASRPAIATALSGDAGIKWFLQNYPEALALDYDEGTIIDTEDYDYETTGVNLWDEEWENGYFNLTTGEPTSNPNICRSKNFISVFPSTEYFYKSNNANHTILYYDADYNYISNEQVGPSNSIINTPSNCFFIKFAWLGTTYNNDIQICFHFTETSVEQTYHKYEIFKDRISWAFTSTGKGKSAGNGVADTKDYVNKKNIEKVGSYTFTGNENWSIASTYAYINGIPSNGKKRGAVLTDAVIPSTITLKELGGTSAIIIVTYSSENKPTLSQLHSIFSSGKILNYELATPIEIDMSGDELDTNIPENDYGVERKVSVSGDMFSGSATTIFYQDNVLRQIFNNKSAIDNLQEELNEVEARIPTAPTADGTYTLKVVVLNGVATYSWELEE